MCPRCDSENGEKTSLHPKIHWDLAGVYLIVCGLIFYVCATAF